MHLRSYFDGLQYAVYGWLWVNREDKVAAVQHEGGSAHYYRSHGTHWAKLRWESDKFRDEPSIFKAFEAQNSEINSRATGL